MRGCDRRSRRRASARLRLPGRKRTQPCSYQAALERDGISYPAELALLGDEEIVTAGLRQYLDAGATGVRVSRAAFTTGEERLRT